MSVEFLHIVSSVSAPGLFRQDVPDEEAIARVFQEALSGPGRSSEPWAFTGHLDSRDPRRQISLHLCRSVEKGTEELVFVEGEREISELH